MKGLIRSVRVAGTVLVEVVIVLALVELGRRPELDVPVGQLGAWLRDGDPATVVVALLRWIALVGAAWVLGSTLLYLAVSLTRVPGAVRAVRWSTLPAVRRAVDAACAVSIATSVALAPAAAGGARAGDPPTVTLVRDGRSGDLGALPADTTTTAPPVSTPRAPSTPVEPAAPTAPPVPPAAPAAYAPAREVTVAEGDNLWVLAARHLAAVSGRPVAEVPDAEVAPYWVRVCDANRDRLASGDPNLVLPGERVVLPA